MRLANASAYVTLFTALIAGDHTRRELVRLSGLGTNTVAKVVIILRRRGLIHVGGWDRDTLGRYTVAVWAWGAGKDAKPPPPRTCKERREAARKRALQDVIVQGVRGTLQL